MVLSSRSLLLIYTQVRFDSSRELGAYPTTLLLGEQSRPFQSGSYLALTELNILYEERRNGLRRGPIPSRTFKPTLASIESYTS